MSIKSIVLMFVIILLGANITLGVDGIGLEVEGFAASEYNFYGYDVFDQHGVWGLGSRYHLPALPVIGEGLSVGVKSFSPLSSGFEEQTEMNYYVGYDFSLISGTPMQIDAGITYTYADYVKANKDSDMQYLTAKVSLPNIITILGNSLVPSAEVVKFWSIDGNNMMAEIDGLIFVFGVDYYVPIMTQVFDLSANITYNDGIGASASNWSHATFGASTDLSISDSITFTPFVNYQLSSENSVAADNSMYGGARVNINF
jgi:hypothetical protein